MTSEENIKVIVRIKPSFNDDSGNNLSKCKDSNSINLPCKYEVKSFTFDMVADERSTQEEIFEWCRSQFESFFCGYNSTIFAYGQPSSGKTHTMTGDKNMPGLIPQGFQFVFDNIRENKETNIEYLVKCSFVDIYNENMFDLLDPSSKRVYLKKNLSQGFYVDRLTEEVIENTKQALQILHSGCCNRHISSTTMNRESSRSHSVFSIILECCEVKDEIKNTRKSVLHLVDLAGSESQKHTNSEGATLKEAGSINKSLLALREVIRKIANNENCIPYLHSKLTKLLKDSIGGNSKTLLIACIHPDIKYTSETLSTLQFASNVKKIKNVAKVNADVSGNVESLQKEVLMLREQLRRRSLNLFVRDDDYNSDSLWQNRFVHAMLLRSKLATENCYLKEKFLLLSNQSENNEADSVGNMDKIELLQSELKAFQLNLLEAKNADSISESAIVSGLYKNYNEIIAAGTDKNEKLSGGNEVEMAKLNEKLLAANLLINQLKRQNALIENARKEEQRKLESEIASMRKVLKENDEEKEIAVNRRQTMIHQKMERESATREISNINCRRRNKKTSMMPIDENIIPSEFEAIDEFTIESLINDVKGGDDKLSNINCRRRNKKTSMMPIDEKIIPSEFEASDEFTIESLINDIKEAEAKIKKHVSHIGKLEYDIKAKEHDILELEKLVEDKDRIEMNFNELKEKFNSIEIDLRTNVKLVKKYENQIRELNINKSKSVKALNEQISNLEEELDNALSERDSFKNELEIVKISKDFLNNDIQKKMDSSLKQENDDDDNDENNIKNSEIFKKYENQIKELQEEIKKSTYDLTEAYGSYQDLKAKHDDREDAILDLEERIIEQDEQISYLNECLSSEKTKYENVSVALDDLFVKTEIKSESVMQGIKQLDIYFISMNHRLRTLLTKCHNYSMKVASLKQEIQINDYNYYELHHLYNAVKVKLDDSKTKTNILNTKISRLRLGSVNVDEQTRHWILQVIGPD